MVAALLLPAPRSFTSMAKGVPKDYVRAYTSTWRNTVVSN